MEKKLNKEERIRDKERLSNAVTGKMAAVFAALVVSLIILVYYGARIPSLALLTAAQIVTAVITAAALVRCIVSIKKGKTFRYSVFSPIFTLGLAASALFMTVMYPTIGATYTILALIAFAVLFFVYEIYPVDFFISSAAVFSGCIAAMTVNSHPVTIFKSGVTLVIYLAVVAVLVSAIVTLLKKGKIKIGKTTVKKPHGMLPAAVFASIAVSLIAVIGVLLFGYLLYFVAAACVLYFIIAIIYTVKLM